MNDFNFKTLNLMGLKKLIELDYTHKVFSEDNETRHRLRSNKPFIVFSTFNNSISDLVQYADEYVVYDQSTIGYWKDRNVEIGAVHRKNVGHSLANIFEFILDNWTHLPETTTFLKANVVPRHCNLEYLENNINNNFYTHFYSDANIETTSNVNEILFPGYYLEINNSWYMYGGNHGIFCSYNDAAGQIFGNYRASKYLMFGPGACFTVSRSQIEKHPKELYELLEYLVSYRFFPDESYIVERMLPMIFLGTYVCHDNLKELLVKLKMKNDSTDPKCAKHRSPKISKRILDKLVRHFGRD